MKIDHATTGQLCTTLMDSKDYWEWSSFWTPLSTPRMLDGLISPDSSTDASELDNIQQSNQWWWEEIIYNFQVFH